MTEVTEKMVEAAFYAFCKSRTGDGKSNAYSMRDAIEAALAAREPVNAGDLVRKLRNSVAHYAVGLRTTDGDLRADAADAIEEMVGALKPFAIESIKWGERNADAHLFFYCEATDGSHDYPLAAFTASDMHRASAVLTRRGVKL